MGFVDQEDMLMSTLTVYETVLYSALLRLPREMSFEAKKFRTLETMHELGILGIKDSRIGETGEAIVSLEVIILKCLQANDQFLVARSVVFQSLANLSPVRQSYS